MQNETSNNNQSSNGVAPTQAIDLMAPVDRFTSTSRLYARLHRHQLLVRKYWWVLLLSALVTLVPICLLTRLTPRAYKSDARMWITGKLDLSEGHLYTEELVNFLGTQADLLRSRTIQDRALATLLSQSSNSPPLKPLPGLLDVLRGTFSAAARKRNQDLFPFQLKVAESSKSSLLELQARGAEPKSTQAYLNALMKEYISFKRENREETSDRAVASLAKQVNQLAGELKAQQERVYSFQMSNNVVFLQEQGNGAGSYLALLNRQLATLRTELQLLQLVQPEQWVAIGTDSSQGSAADPIPGQVSAHDLMAGLSGARDDLFRANQQTQLLKARREELSKVLRPMHPKILKLNQDIATQEKLLEVSRNEIMKQLVNRRQALQLEVNNLEKVFGEWETRTVDAGRKMVDYERLKQDALRTQAAYDKLLSMISTVDVGKSVDQQNVSVLETASEAAPVSTWFRNLALAAALALVLGGGLIWLLGKFDDRFTCSSELTEGIPEPLLGQITDLAASRMEGQMRPEILAGEQFEFLESFRSIRSALYFMDGRNGNHQKTLLVSSSVPQEGKSTIALYLAATMALAGSKVLLLDGDMRRARLHRRFGVPSSPGLAEVLDEEASASRAITSTAIQNLAFMPAGAPRVEPGELVLSPRMHGFLREIYSRFDYIIVDSPPILAADDAAALAPIVDGVLFVVRAAYTSARFVREGLETLRQRRARVLGLILNRAVESPFAHQQYRRYRNQYRWQAKQITAAT